MKSLTRRALLSSALVALTTPVRARSRMLTLYTFGDSVLDCGHYNARGVHPGQLLVKNDDAQFPEMRGQDLASLGPARLVHRAVDGATVDGLAAQARGLEVEGPSLAILTVGGNDLLRGLLVDEGPGLRRFEQRLDAFLKALPVRPVLVANVYDPSLGDDRQNFTSVAPRIGRKNHERVNAVLAAAGARCGVLVDLHGWFLRGDASWFTRTIEPSLRGAHEVRRCFLPAVLAAARGSQAPQSKQNEKVCDHSD
jgi:lysophospholipase L1-like esterase